MNTYCILSRQKRLIIAFVFLAISSVSLLSCEKDDVASATPGTLSVSTTSFKQPSDVVTFSWTAAAIKNTGTGIGLFLQFDKAGNNFQSPSNVYLGRDILSKEFNGGAFNNILKNNMALPSASETNVEVRLRSVSSDGTLETFFSNPVEMSVTPFDPPPYSKLWMVGDATPNGWNIDNPSEMQQDPGDPFIFLYNGPMNIGEFKIPTTTGNWGTDFYMPMVNHQDISLSDMQLVIGGNPDLKWHIAAAGSYRVTVNLFTKTIEIKMQ